MQDRKDSSAYYSPAPNPQIAARNQLAPPYFYSVKQCLVLICLNYCLLGHAQPGGFANGYPLGRQLQLSGSNWVDINQCPDGSILVRAANYPYQHLHSTTVNTVRFGSSLNTINTNQIMGLGGTGTWFFETSGKLVKRQGDSLWLHTDTTFYYSCIVLKTGILFMPKLGTNVLPQYFDGTKMFNIAIPQGIVRLPADTIAVTRDAYTGDAVLGFQQQNASVALFRFKESEKTLQYLNTYRAVNTSYALSIFGADSALLYLPNRGKTIVNGVSNKFSKSFYDIGLLGGMPNVELIKQNGGNYIRNISKTGFKLLPISGNDRVQSLFEDKYYNSYYIGGATTLQRVFPHVVQYPRLYNNDNSNANHTLVQTADGNIYVGSYNTGLAKITNQGIQYIPTTYAFLPGGIGIGNDAYFFTENASAFIRVNSMARIETVLKYRSGFYNTLSRNNQYVYEGYSGVSSFGIVSVSKMFDGLKYRRIVGAKQGVRLLNILTLTEDKRGRIWFGRTSQGWGVYYPKTDTAICFTSQNSETVFGANSSYCDNEGTVWFGGNNGLWYVNANGDKTITANDAARFSHPLLPDGKLVSAIKQWGNYLVLGAGKDVLLIDLNAFYRNDKAQIVRYLNPQETNLTADCEQNTMLIDRRDSSIWIATGDNVYNLDLKKWLGQPVYNAEPSIIITTKIDSTFATAGLLSQFEPTQNSFRVQVRYQTNDNMPRYLQYAFVAEGDTAKWGNVSLSHEFDAYSLRSGRYTFFVRLFQQNGTISTYQFPFVIKKFFWQQWWFWVLLSAALLGATVYLFYLHKQKQLAEANAARIAAEADAFRSQQQRKLTGMQVKSLSTQFRPHFILNALNTIGAQLYDKPEVDAVLGQLGDSIGIIFRSAQEGSIAHPLSLEWRLVESVCSIKQMEFGQNITIHRQIPQELLHNENLLVPMGILQIPVENALVHGLRNKETGPKDLWISTSIDDDGKICFSITDNGIGRKAAALISNYRSNGVGTKNLVSIIELLNQNNTNLITLHYEDEIFDEAGVKCGTRVIICIPENYVYDI